MKKRLLSLALIMVLALSVLSGCSSFTPLTGGPEVNASVTSNGGMAVRKGNYLYFVNGYLESSDLVEGDNQYNNEQNSAVYRAQLDGNGELMTNEEEELTNIELLIPKVVGFEDGGFYIFDNYIYYATPTILKDRTGTVRFDLVDFYRANLDGTGIQKLYATNEYSSGDFSFIKINDVVYLLIFDGSSVIKINTSTRKSTTLIENANSVILPKVKDYNAENNTVDDENKYVYYTRALKEDEAINTSTGNVLAKVQIEEGEEIPLDTEFIYTYVVKSVTNGTLYYTKNTSTSVSTKTYSRALAGTFLDNSETQHTGTGYSTVLPIGTNGWVVVSDSSKIVLVSNVALSAGTELLVEESNELLFTNGDYAYFVNTEDNVLKRVNVVTNTVDVLSNEEEKVKIVEGLTYDFDGEYVYYYVTKTNEAGESVYLHRVKVVATEFQSQFVGVLEEKHLPDPEEETTEETTEQ